MESNYQLSRIHNYVNGLMSKEEMYELEREALDDPFLQDAIDGYALQDGVDVGKLSLLQKRLAARIETQAQTKNKRFYSWQRLAVGMAAAVMFVTVCTLLLIRYLPQKTAGLTEVEIMSDQMYEIIVSPSESSSAVPEMGWDALGTFISKNLKYSTTEGFITVALKVNSQGKASDITTNTKDEAENEELVKLLHKVKWKGQHAQFSIEIRKINI